MLHRKKFWLIVLSIVLVITLAACASPETPAEDAAQETGEEEVAEEAVEEVAEEEPAQVTQSDITLGLSVHNDPAVAHFWGVVELGARDAAELHGISC